jgi:hypothetical protein
MKIELTGDDSQPVATWTTETLTHLPNGAIHNDFAYNVFKLGPYGLVAAMGAIVTITLPPPSNAHSPLGGNVTLRVTDVNGSSFSLKLTSVGKSL